MVPIVEILISKGANVFAYDSEGMFVLVSQCYRRYKFVVKSYLVTNNNSYDISNLNYATEKCRF